MRNHQIQTKDLVISIALICFFLFVFRLWPLILLVLLGGGVILSKRLLFPRQEMQERQPMIQEPMNSHLEDADFWSRKCEFAVEKVSCLVEKEYPNARWIWEDPNWKESIQKNEELYIRLNKTGGYRRAKISLQDGFVSEMEILPNVSKETVDNEPKQAPKQSKDDGARIAFEWVETHLLELNERCNEIIGQGENELMLTSSELPEEKCWEYICKELVKAGLEQVNIVSGEGIKILLN